MSTALVAAGGVLAVSLSLSRLALLLATFALIFSSTNAYAGDPVGDTWFVTAHDYSSDSCDPDGVDMCSLNSSTGRYECKGANHDASNEGIILVMISNESDPSTTDICDGYDYCGFGAVKTGVSSEDFFYCQWDKGSIKKMSATGTGYDDFLYFHHDQNGAFDLEEHTSGTLLTGYMYGLGGDDEVHGSRHASSDQNDDLSGGPGGDIIWGHDGDDAISAGSGNDIVWAGPGNDIIQLDSGTNECSGEDGEDTIVGGTDSDRIHGGDNDDTIDTHGSQDFICGGDGNDEMDAGSGNGDEVWGGGGLFDVADGGPGTGDECDAETESNCTVDLVVEPAECPDEHEY